MHAAKPFACSQLVEAGESEYLGLLKTRNLLIFRDAKNAEHGKIAPNWNVSGTQGFQSAGQFVRNIFFLGNCLILPSDFCSLPPNFPESRLWTTTVTLEGGMQEALRVHGLMRRTLSFAKCYRVVPFLHC